MNMKPVFVREGYELIGQTLVNENDPEDTLNNQFLRINSDGIIFLVEVEPGMIFTYGFDVNDFAPDDFVGQNTFGQGIVVDDGVGYSFFLPQIYVNDILHAFEANIRSFFLELDEEDKAISLSPITFKPRSDLFKRMPNALESHILSFLPVKEQASLAGNIVGDRMVPVDITYNQYKKIYNRPDVDKTQIRIIRNFTRITDGIPLPDTLQELSCESDISVQLPDHLPSQLKILDCGVSDIETLPPLPNTLIKLFCYSNQLTTLPPLPPSLEVLVCFDNGLTSLPELPLTLRDLACHVNALSRLPQLPPYLSSLYCRSNHLSALPELPTTLKTLACESNNLTSLPPLPPNLKELDCSNNQLTTLPVLPQSLIRLQCYDNPLESIPEIPPSVIWE